MVESYAIADKIDSLKSAIEINNDDTTLMFQYLSLGEQYRGHHNDTAMLYYEKAYTLACKIKHTDGQMRAVNFIGILNLNQGNFDDALNNFMEALKLSEQDNNLFGQSISYQNMGLVHASLENVNRSREYFIKAMELREEIKDTGGVADCCIGIGLSYQSEEKYDSALYYFNRALDIAGSINNRIIQSYCYTNMGHIFRTKGDVKKGLDAYLKAYEINKESDNKQSLAADLISIGQAYLDMDEYMMAEKYTKEGLEYAIESGKKEFEKNAYITLYVLFKEIGSFENALEYYEQYSELNNELFNTEKNRQIEDMEAKYALEKHQQEIALQKSRINEQESQIKQEKFQKIVLYCGLLLFLIIALIVYRNYRIKKKLAAELIIQKNEIKEKNEELFQQNEEISSQRDEIEAQRDMVIRQKEKIETIHRHLSDSIDYATRIQSSILSDQSILREYFGEHFTLYMPKDKVSGDFYWWAHVEGQTVIAVADCTGHGVPGAFMSMLGISFLREIVMKEYITHTGVILRKLRKEIIKVLKQKEETQNPRDTMIVRDGMDMAVISVNHQSKTVQFSGANNPLYIISDSASLSETEYEIFPKTQGDEYNLFELKGDRMPIAIYDKMDKYGVHDINLKEGDQIYLFSDGYPDQFGGSEGKKMKYMAFRELLLKNAGVQMNIQKEQLVSVLKNWKGEFEQIDDILVVGIKL